MLKKMSMHVLKTGPGTTINGTTKFLTFIESNNRFKMIFKILHKNITYNANKQIDVYAKLSPDDETLAPNK